MYLCMHSGDGPGSALGAAHGQVVGIGDTTQLPPVEWLSHSALLGGQQRQSAVCWATEGCLVLKCWKGGGSLAGKTFCFTSLMYQ